jgi:Uma2 family endonuclease
MSTQSPARNVVYPDDDGLPLSDNMLQYEWIAKIAGCLMALFRDNPDVVVAGNLLWYPVEGDNKTRTAPDAMVVFGRPKGYRGSYKQWCEDEIPPQVVFEVLSPGNRFGEMMNKLAFYDRHGVEEYYVINPDPSWVDGWRRVDGVLAEIPEMNGWVSPRLGVRFELRDYQLFLIGPDGRPFETVPEMAQRAEESQRLVEEAHQQVEEAHRRTED